MDPQTPSIQYFHSCAPTSDCICNIKGSGRDKHPPPEIELLLGGGSSPPTTSIHVSPNNAVTVTSWPERV